MEAILRLAWHIGFVAQRPSQSPVDESVVEVLWTVWPASRVETAGFACLIRLRRLRIVRAMKDVFKGAALAKLPDNRPLSEDRPAPNTPHWPNRSFDDSVWPDL